MIPFSLSQCCRISFLCLRRHDFFASRLIPELLLFTFMPIPSVPLFTNSSARGGEFVFASSAPQRSASPKLHLLSFNHSIPHRASDITNQRRWSPEILYECGGRRCGAIFSVVFLKGKRGPFTIGLSGLKKRVEIGTSQVGTFSQFICSPAVRISWKRRCPAAAHPPRPCVYVGNVRRTKIRIKRRRGRRTWRWWCVSVVTKQPITTAPLTIFHHCRLLRATPRSHGNPLILLPARVRECCRVQ